MENNIRQFIEDADLVLIGIGKEFEKDDFQTGEDALQALNKLAKVLEKKNYFAVSICTNDIAKESDLQSDRVVQPCGTVAQKQCVNKCEEGLQELTEAERSLLEQKLAESVVKENGKPIVENSVGGILNRIAQDDVVARWQKIYAEGFLGTCPKCGSLLVLNTVYTDAYDEKGYLKDWSRYTTWLQGTLNKKLCILELGVDLTYPSIIRWPFEKVAFYNQKAHFVRVNERLYHMSQEIKDKGISISENAVKWLLEM